MRRRIANARRIEIQLSLEPENSTQVSRFACVQLAGAKETEPGSRGAFRCVLLPQPRNRPAPGRTADLARKGAGRRPGRRLQVDVSQFGGAAMRRIVPVLTLLLTAVLAPPRRAAAQDPGAEAERPANGAPTVVGPRDPLRGLEHFPYIIVAPADPLDPFAKDGSLIIEQRSLDEWKRSQIALLAKREGTPLVASIRLNVELGSDDVRVVAVVNVRVDSPTGSWVGLDCREAYVNEVSLREQVPAAPEVGGVRWTEAWTPPIRRRADGFQIRIDRSGAYECTLDLRATPSAAPSGASMRLSLPSSAAVRARVVGDAPFASLRGGAPPRELAVAADGRSAELSLRPDEPLALTWRAQDPAGGATAAVAGADGTIHVRVDDDALRMQAHWDLMLAEDARQVEVRLPARANVVEVAPSQDDDVVPHELEMLEEADCVRVRVRLGRAAAGSVRIRLAAEFPFPSSGDGSTQSTVRAASFAAPEWSGARRQTGTLFLSWPAELWVRSLRPKGLERIGLNDPSIAEAPDPPKEAYAYSSLPAALDLAVQEARPTLATVADHDLRVGRDRTEWTSTFRISVRGAPADSFALLVPREMRIVESRPAAVVEVEEGATGAAGDLRRAAVRLVEPIQDGDFEWTVRGEAPGAESAVRRTPIPSLETGRLVRGSLTVRAEPGIRLVLNDSETEYLRREPVPEDDVGDPPPYWRFQLQSGPARLGYSVERRPMRLTSSVEAEFRRGAREMDVRIHLRYRAEHGAFEEAALAIPDGIDDLEVAGDFADDEPAIGPGLQVFRLRNPVREAEIRVAYRLLLDDERPSEVHVPLVCPRGATLVDWKGRVYGDRGRRTSALSPWIATKSAPTRSTAFGERADVDVRPPALDAVPDALGLRFEPTAAMAALVVPRVLVEEVMADEGRRWCRKRWLISRRRTRDATVRMPLGARQLDVVVDGLQTDAAPEGARDFRVRLPASDASCTLEVVYDFPNWTWGGALAMRRLEAPQLLDDAAVEQVRWVLRAPDDRLLARVGAGLSTDVAWEFPGFLRAAAANGRFSDPSAWLAEADPDAKWRSVGFVGEGGRAWDFDAFGEADSIRVVSLREPLWVLICSGASFLSLLAAARLKPHALIRLALAAAVVVVGLLAAAPNVAAWLWMGAQWGVYLGLAAAAIHYWLLYRRLRAYSVGLRRFNARQMGFGSSILRRFDPQTRISSVTEARQP